jgi:hypothetical protein
MLSGKYEGWGSEGVPRYNILCNAIRDNQVENKDYDQEYQCGKKDEHGRLGQRKRNSTETSKVVRIYTDLDDCGITFAAV